MPQNKTCHTCMQPLALVTIVARAGTYCELQLPQARIAGVTITLDSEALPFNRWEGELCNLK